MENFEKLSTEELSQVNGGVGWLIAAAEWVGEKTVEAAVAVYEWIEEE
ncbi:bacteriocin class II family protein [Marinoscillum pacificum]|nr:bacteriocin class II family protein [Marinoscillum pacificum]